MIARFVRLLMILSKKNSKEKILMKKFPDENALLVALTRTNTC
jgi:hypothetical protein